MPDILHVHNTQFKTALRVHIASFDGKWQCIVEGELILALGAASANIPVEPNYRYCCCDWTSTCCCRVGKQYIECVLHPRLPVPLQLVKFQCWVQNLENLSFVNRTRPARDWTAGPAGVELISKSISAESWTNVVTVRRSYRECSTISPTQLKQSLSSTGFNLTWGRLQV